MTDFAVLTIGMIGAPCFIRTFSPLIMSGISVSRFKGIRNSQVSSDAVDTWTSLDPGKRRIVVYGNTSLRTAAQTYEQITRMGGNGVRTTRELTIR